MELFNSVSSMTICNWFYLMFILNSVVGAVMLLRLIIMIIYTRPGLLMGSVAFFVTILAVAIPIINGAFFYTMCDRALAPLEEWD